MKPGSGWERIQLGVDGAVAKIVLDRIAQLNAIDVAMHRQLRAGLDRIESDSAIRAVILTGSGNAFCSGQDLGERAAVFVEGDRPDLRASLEDFYNPLVRRLASLPMPVIAAVNGIAFGAGAALAIGCDVVLAGQSARFQFGFVNVGLGPDCGTSWLLPRIVGLQRALELTLSGRSVAADEAERLGIASRVVPDTDLPEASRDLANQLASNSPEALAVIKRQLRGATTQSFDAALDAERDAQAMLGDSQAYRDAVMRFADRAR